MRRIDDPDAEPLIVDQKEFTRRKHKKHRQQTYAPGLDLLAREIGYSSYASFLRSAKWKKIRLEVLERDGHCCRDCGATQTLQVHHKHYYDLLNSSACETLCAGCHMRRHPQKHR